jgi:hypothetical protein
MAANTHTTELLCTHCTQTPLVAGVVASQAGLALVEFILALTASGVKKVALLTMDFWIQLQETPVAERHPR